MLQRLKPATDLIWPALALAFFLFLYSMFPFSPVDFWWHLKVGEIIHMTGEIPTTNLFAWTIPADAPFHYSAWLGDYLLYLPYLVGQLEMVIFLRNLIVSAVLLLMMVETRRQTGSWRFAALTVILGGFMIWSNLSMRPQLWSVLAFAIFAAVLNRYREKQLHPAWLILCPLVMLFWVNAHGAFILGGILLGITVVGEGLRTALKRPDHLSWQEISWLILAGALTFLAIFVNPRGAGIWTYVLNLTGSITVAEIAPEWQPPTIYGGTSKVIFFASLLLLLVLLIYSRYRPTITEVILIICFTWLAWSATRHVLWFGVLIVPIIVRVLQHLPLKIPPLASQKNWLNLVVILVLFIPVLLVQPWLLEEFPLPDAYWEIVYKGEEIGPLVIATEPLRAVEYLEAHPGGRLFNGGLYSSYMIWAIPEQGVFIDPRLELFTQEHWDDYYRITDSIRYQELLAQYGADRLMLDRANQPELVHAVLHDPDWVVEYQDDLTVILRQSTE